MATLNELKDEILKGRKIRRKAWTPIDGDMHFETYRVHLAEDIHNLFVDDWELEPLPKVKKKVKLYACIHIGDAQKNIWVSVMYRAAHLFVGTENIIRLPNLDQEIEVDE